MTNRPVACLRREMRGATEFRCCDDHGAGGQDQRDAGGRARAGDAVEVDPETIGLEIRADHRRHYLVVSAHQQFARVHLASEKVRRGVQTVAAGLLLRRYAEERGSGDPPAGVGARPDPGLDGPEGVFELRSSRWSAAPTSCWCATTADRGLHPASRPAGEPRARVAARPALRAAASTKAQARSSHADVGAGG